MVLEVMGIIFVMQWLLTVKLNSISKIILQAALAQAPHIVSVKEQQNQSSASPYKRFPSMSSVTSGSPSVSYSTADIIFIGKSRFDSLSLSTVEKLSERSIPVFKVSKNFFFRNQIWVH